MGEVVDAINAIAQLGRDSAKFDERFKALEEKLEVLEKRPQHKGKWELLLSEPVTSAVKFLAVVIGAILLMWLAGDHVVSLLRPKVPTLAQRIGQFALENDPTTAINHLDACVGELKSFRWSLDRDAGQQVLETKPGAGSTEARPTLRPQVPGSSANQSLRIAPQQVVDLRRACGQIVGE